MLFLCFFQIAKQGLYVVLHQSHCVYPHSLTPYHIQTTNHLTRTPPNPVPVFSIPHYPYFIVSQILNPSKHTVLPFGDLLSIDLILSFNQFCLIATNIHSAFTLCFRFLFVFDFPLHLALCSQRHQWPSTKD